MEHKTRIKGNVHYVGVNDRNKHRFEAMWPLPYGVSYNSYLIDDEMVALVDTVDICYFEVYLRKIKQVIGERPINYLIINHMEPDHSGSIRLIKQHYPEIIIVGNKQTFGMIEGFYGVTGEQYLVKDGDFLALGHHKLRFYMTPMVHWPETMMTFDETEGILFSGDGFGCFGTLDGGFLDTGMNVDRYWGEMVRYYSNIVGKYGPQVKSLLEKAATLDIKMICPVHGPIWRENIGWYVDKYMKWATYTPEDKAVVIDYGSVYGNTVKAMNILACKLGDLGVRNIKMYDVSNTHSSQLVSEAFRASNLVFASITYNNGIFTNMKNVLEDLKNHNIQNRTVALVENGTWGPLANKQMKEIVEGMKNMTILDETVTIKSSLKESQMDTLDSMAKAIYESMK